MDPRIIMALTMVKGLGPVTWRKVENALGTPEAMMNASVSDLKEAGVKQEVAQNIAHFNQWDQVDQNLKQLDSLDGRIIAFADPGYPQPLKHLHDPPGALFMRGQWLASDELSVAMVGTRKAGGYGKRIARKLAFRIASSNVTVISGLARGIDSESHGGALDAKGRTVAVLGNGLDVTFPPENDRLTEKIVQNGAVITEYPPGTASFAGNFPRRNRIIAGLCAALLVVESPMKSGSKITSRFAAEQGKTVLVVPGPIDDPNFQGNIDLIKQGATPVWDALDILQVVLPEAARQMDLGISLTKRVEKPEITVNLSPSQSKVFEQIGPEPVNVDTLAGQTGLTIENLLYILLELELQNLVTQLPGKRFRLNLET